MAPAQLRLAAQSDAHERPNAESAQARGDRFYGGWLPTEIWNRTG